MTLSELDPRVAPSRTRASLRGLGCALGLWSQLAGCDDAAPAPNANVPAPAVSEQPALGVVDAQAPRAMTGDAGMPAPVVALSPRAAANDAGVGLVSAEAGAPVVAAQPVADDTYLGLSAPRSGFRLKTRGAMIPDGRDTEICEVAELPGTPEQEYIVGAVELANGRSSHHLIVTVAEPGSSADKKLRSIPVGTQMPCVSAQIEYGEGMVSVAGSQTALSKYSLPAGVGMRLRGGQRVVFDYHYFNYSGKEVKGESAAAFHTLAKSEIKNISASFAFTNMTLDTPPHGKGTYTATCRFKQDVMMQSIARHTHTQGTDFTVWFEGGAKHGQQIWQSLDWEHDQQFDFPAPVLLKAGEGFKFACSYRNETAMSLRFGIAAKDEMCILSGPIWSPTPGAELGNVQCVVTWVDAQGIGHDARDEGGFPAPKSDELLFCTLNTVGVGLLDSCVECICGSCAAPFKRCNEDVDCQPIIACRAGCEGGPGPACEESCEPVMFAHSGGVGMAAQLGECVLNKCGSQCVIGGTSGATMR